MLVTQNCSLLVQFFELADNLSSTQEKIKMYVVNGDDTQNMKWLHLTSQISLI